MRKTARMRVDIEVPHSVEQRYFKLHLGQDTWGIRDGILRIDIEGETIIYPMSRVKTVHISRMEVEDA